MYALNINKGTRIVHPSLGLLEAGIAVSIPNDMVHIAKNLKGVVIFEKVAGIDENKVKEKLYGKDLVDLKEKIEKQEDKLNYQDFVKKYKDIAVASQKWEEHKKKLESG